MKNGENSKFYRKCPLRVCLNSSSLKKKNKTIIIATFFSLILLCVYSSFLTVPVISDETTTMANAAWLSGYDWSWMVTALGGYYYRFGQALLTVPFFALLDDPGMIYCLSMVLQSMIQASIVPIVYIICRRHLSVESSKTAALLGMAVCLIPSMVLYTFYYRGDFLLGILPWYVLLFFLETVKAVDEKRRARRIIYTVLTAFFSVFSYTAHTRGIIVIIALVLAIIFLRIFEKKKSLHWGCLFLVLFFLFSLDSEAGNIFKNALYAIGGLNANAIESTDVGAYFAIFTYDAIKDLVMLCLSWLQTLVASTQGLVLIGIVALFSLFIKVWFTKSVQITVNEKIATVFSGLIFAGYYAAGALFFRGTYLALRTGELERRVDRLLYDRYAICGAGMIIFLALYVLCCKREWFRMKEKLISIIAAVFIFAVWIWKILPTAVKYTGYIYNAIILNTFNTISDPAKILSGEYFTREALLGISILGGGLMLIILVISLWKNKRCPYVILAVVLLSDLLLIHVNYIKVRKASNDYVAEATREVVDFMQEFEDEITDSYPYVLKGSLSGIRIQFYQSQLMNYKMFGKRQEEQLGQDNYFIISDHDDIDLTWFEDDYYLFEDFDYENAEYDIVYVKGEKLMREMERLGYEMVEYVPQEEKA